MTASRRPACYIHIGPHKTGSSSIQQFMWTNAAALARLGLYVPALTPSATMAGKCHLDLAKTRELSADGSVPESAELWPELDRVARRGDSDILISSEIFTRALRHPEAFDPILAFFARRGYRVVVIVYVRDQPGWLNSWYVQQQKRLHALRGFEEFELLLAREGRVEPQRFLRPFLDDDRFELSVVSFERAIKAGLERDFFSRCGVPAAAELDGAGLRNPNAGAKTVFAAQEIMRRAGDGLSKLSGYGQVYGRFKNRCRDAGWETTPFMALDNEAAARIRDRYAASNDAFARRIFGERWRDVCPPKDHARSVFDPAQASAAERAEIEDVVAETVGSLRALRSGGPGPARPQTGKARRGLFGLRWPRLPRRGDLAI